MSTIKIRTGEALKLSGGLFEQTVVIPCPLQGDLRFEKTKRVFELVFKRVVEEYNINRDKEFKPVIPRELVATLEQAYKEVTFNSDLNTIHRKILSEVIPNEDSVIQQEKTHKIYHEGIVIQITRLFIQSLFDKLQKEPTHMRVDTPFAPRDTQWKNIKKTFDSEDFKSADTTVKMNRVNAILLSGDYFTHPVIIPTPNTHYITQRISKNIVRDTFDDILSLAGISQFSTTPYEDFHAVETKQFAQKLDDSIINKINESSIRFEDDHEEEMVIKLRETLPDTHTMDTYPDKIKTADRIVYITRMVLQTWFDLLSTNKTHMSVADPFKPHNHMWKEPL